LIKKCPSGEMSYWKVRKAGATMRVWESTRGAPADPGWGSKLTAINFLLGSMKKMCLPSGLQWGWGAARLEVIPVGVSPTGRAVQ
jgi:hypothetical protein